MGLGLSIARKNALLSGGDLKLIPGELRLPDGDGVDLLRALKRSDDPTPVVMISGHGTIRCC